MPTEETMKISDDNPGWFELGGCCCRGGERDAEFLCPECNLRFSCDLAQIREMNNTGSSLRFATLGGKYPWRDFHPLESCHARHT